MEQREEAWKTWCGDWRARSKRAAPYLERPLSGTHLTGYDLRPKMLEWSPGAFAASRALAASQFAGEKQTRGCNPLSSALEMEQQDLDMKTPGRNVTSGGVAGHVRSEPPPGAFEASRALSEPPLTRVIQGTALRTAIREAKSLSDRLGLLGHFTDVCRAVGVAHGRGIIHRALHPSSIVITDFGECVVSNWSLSKARRKEDSHGAEIEAALKSLRCRGVADAFESPPSRGPALSEPPLSPDVPSKGEARLGGSLAPRLRGDAFDASRAILDPAFLAPELARGHMESVDTRSDVYALGAVLYELLTGQPPFTGENPADVLDAVASRKPTPVSEVEPTVSTELANICERAMHQEPSARYASAKHLAEELERTTVVRSAHDTTGRSPRVPSEPRFNGTAPQMVSPPKVQSVAAGVRSAHAGKAADTGPKYRIALALVSALLVLVIGIAAFSQRRVVRERDEAMAAQRQGEQQLAALQQEHDQLARELEDTQAARREAEAERDQAEAGRREALENARKAQKQLEKTDGKTSQQSAREEGTAGQEPGHPTGILQEQVSPESPGTEETPTPAEAGAMRIVPPRNMPAKFLGPYAGGQAAAAGDAGQRPPGVTRAQLARALPQFIGTLKMEKTQDGKMAVMVSCAVRTTVVGTPGGEAADSLKLLGFKDGDVITNINRSAIETVVQAKSAFERTKNDSGLTVRIVREGQSSWMRINVFEKLPPMSAAGRKEAASVLVRPAKQAPGRMPTPPQNIPLNPPSKGEPPPSKTSPQEAPESPAQLGGGSEGTPPVQEEQAPLEAPSQEAPETVAPSENIPLNPPSKGETPPEAPSQEPPETGAPPAEETPPAETPAEPPSAEQSPPRGGGEAPEASAAESPPSEEAPPRGGGDSTEPTPAEETTAGEPAPSPESESEPVEGSQSSDQTGGVPSEPPLR